MKALVLTEDRHLALMDRPYPVPRAPGDVVVRIMQAGICGTDRGVLVGKFPARTGVVMGHEAVGEVAEVGAGVSSLDVGDRVIVNPTLYCGLCDRCRSGRLNFCAKKEGNEIGIDRDGAFAEYLRLEEQFLLRVPADMDLDRAVLVEPLACVLNNLDAARLRPGDSITILGGGPIGLVTAFVADHFGHPVRLVESDEFRRSSASHLFAAIPGCHARAVGPAQVADQCTAVVIDTVGSLLDWAIDLAEDAGTIVIMGFHEMAEVGLRPLHILQRGLTIVGAGDYNSVILPRAVELARRLPLDRLVSHRFPLDEFEAALAAVGVGAGADGYTGMKVLIEGRTARP